MGIKVSKRVWVLLSVGIFLVLLVTLGMAYRTQAREQGQLNKQITAAEEATTRISLAELEAKEAEFKAQLAVADAQTAAIKADLNQSTNGIAAADALLQIAAKARVNLTEVASAAAAVQKVETLNCAVLPLSVKVEGEIQNLMTFILSISQTFATGIIRSVDVNIPPTGDAAQLGRSKASIVLNIYCYEVK